MTTTHDMLLLSSVFELARDPTYGMVWIVSCPAGHAHLFELESHGHALAFARAKWAGEHIYDDMTPPCKCDLVSRKAQK